LLRKSPSVAALVNTSPLSIDITSFTLSQNTPVFEGFIYGLVKQAIYPSQAIIYN